jgi:hypothetical protein
VPELNGQVRYHRSKSRGCLIAFGTKRSWVQIPPPRQLIHQVRATSSREDVALIRCAGSSWEKSLPVILLDTFEDTVLPPRRPRRPGRPRHRGHPPARTRAERRRRLRLLRRHRTLHGRPSASRVHRASTVDRRSTTDPRTVAPPVYDTSPSPRHDSLGFHTCAARCSTRRGYDRRSWTGWSAPRN